MKNISFRCWCTGRFLSRESQAHVAAWRPPSLGDGAVLVLFLFTLAACVAQVGAG